MLFIISNTFPWKKGERGKGEREKGKSEIFKSEQVDEILL